MPADGGSLITLFLTLDRERARVESPVTVEEHDGELELRLPVSCSEP